MEARQNRESAGRRASAEQEPAVVRRREVAEESRPAA
jgi:hypothetical protein